MSNLQGVRDHLRFVRYDGASSDKCLQLAVKAVQKVGGSVHWTSCDQVDKELIYVLGNFDCLPYKKVAGIARVIGPMVILELATKHLRIPFNPVFTMAMHGLVVCCTQTGGKETRAKLQQLVKMMGGKFTEHFTRNVTHLVAGQVGSTKYKVARKLRIPVVKPSWVDTCWEGGMENFFNSNDKALLSAHWCPVLSGCVITSTGFSLEDRSRLQKLCQENGAEYSGQLVRDACTHLIVGNKSSEKYRRACQWRVVCVSMQWVHDSVKAGYCLDEEDYNMAERQEGAEPSKPTTNTAATRPDWTKELDQFVVPSSNGGSSFLDGCKIYITGFSDLQLEKLCKLVNYGGGVRYNRLSEQVSHVVVGISQPSELARIAQLHNRPAVVLSSWLLDCCRRNTKLSENDYKLETNQEESVAITTNARKRKTGNATGPNSKKHNKATSMATVEDNDDLMSQYQDAVMPRVSHTGDGGGDGLFSGMTVSISDRFPSSAREAISTEVTKHGGSIVIPGNSCTYYVAPLAHHSSYLPPSAIVVTMLWLERCLEANIILDPSSHFLFSPLPYSTVIDTLLSGYVLTISQYSGLEREHLVRLGRSLGASVQDCFARYPSGGMLGTTHLILLEPAGEKYKHSLKWGVPAVKDSWLFACAKAQQVVSVEEHRIVGSPQPHNFTTPTKATPTLTTTPTKATPTLATTPTKGHTRLFVNASSSSISMDTSLVESEAVHFKTPLKSFRPHFDVEEAVEGLASQVDGPNTQMATMFRANMEKALETVSEYEKKAETRGTILQDVVICVSKKLSSLQVELHNIGNSLGAHCQWSFSSNQCTHYLYQGKPYEAARDREVQQAKESGCYIVSHHWLLTCSASGVREDESLFPSNYNPQKALSLSTQKSPSSQLERHNSTVQDVPMLDSRVYGLQREETQIITEEEQEQGEEEEQEEEKEEEEEEGNDDNDREEVDPPHQGGEQLRRQIQQIMENTGMNQKRQHAGVLMRRQQLSPPKLLLHDDNVAKKKTRQFYRLQQSLSSCDSLPTDSQVMTVTYDDPQAREERQKLLAKIRQVDQEGLQEENFESLSAMMTDTYTESALVRSELTETVGAHSDELSEKITNYEERGKGESVEQAREVLPSATPVPAPSLNMPIVAQCKPTNPEELLYDEQATRMKTRHSHQQSIQHKFLLSSLNLQEKADYGALIQELGGVYLDTDHFVVDCTHLIVGRSSRTEKYLAACASGKWVLNKSYMEACRGNESFVEEEAYEWRGANPDKRSVLDDAPRKWRLKIAKRREQEGHVNSSHAAFDGWKVLLCVESAKLSGLKRVLEAGGAEVFLHSNTAAIASGCITQAFINMAVLRKIPQLSLEHLVEHGVLCLKPDYIADYLQREPDPRSQQYVIPEAWHLMNTK